MASKDEAVAEFVVRFKDEVSGAVNSAAHALENLRKRIKDDESSLASMQKAMKRLQTSTVVDVDAFRKLRQAMEDTKKTLASNQAAFVSLGGDVTKMGQSLIEPEKKSRSFKDRLRELQGASVDLPGPIGRITGSLTRLVEGISAAQLKLIALVAGFAAATLAATAFAVSLAKSAIIAQDARRNELLHLEALTKMRNMWGLAAGSSAEMQDAIDRVSAGVSISRDKVASYAEQLYRSGLRGNALATALEGASVKASALGEAAGSAFAGFAATVNMTGGSVKRLAEDVRNRFGGVVAAKMKSLEVSALKQKEAFDSIFSGLHIEGALDAFTRLRTLFAQNTESGRVMKQLMTVVLQPLINAAQSAATFMRRFFKQMLIGVGEIVLAYVIVRDKWREAFGSSKQQKDMSSILDKIQLGRYAVYTLGVAFVWTGIRLTAMLIPALLRFGLTLAKTTLQLFTRAIPAMWGFAASMWGAVAPLLPIIGLVLLAGAALWGLYKIGELLYTVWNEIDWSDLGRNIWDGIVGGIKSMYGKIQGAFSGLATRARDAFKNALGISSPSKVFAELGVNITRGVEVGVKQGTPAAQAAVSDMVATPAAGDVSARAAGGTSTQISIGELHVHASGDQPEHFADAVRRKIETVLEELAAELGARPAGAQ